MVGENLDSGSLRLPIVGMDSKLATEINRSTGVIKFYQVNFILCIFILFIISIWEDLVVCVCVCVCNTNGRSSGLPDVDQNLGMDSHLP